MVYERHSNNDTSRKRETKTDTQTTETAVQKLHREYVSEGRATQN